MPQSNPGSPRRRALITGASRGIGAAFARRLAQAGVDLTLVARQRNDLETLAQDLRRQCDVDVTVLVADLAGATDLRAVEDAVANDAAVELVINNAGLDTAKIPAFA